MYTLNGWFSLKIQQLQRQRQRSEWSGGIDVLVRLEDALDEHLADLVGDVVAVDERDEELILEVDKVLRLHD